MFPYFRVFLVDLLLSTFLKVVGSDKPKAGLWLPGRQLLPIPWITHLRATASYNECWKPIPEQTGQPWRFLIREKRQWRRAAGSSR
jgi:hypothetical protein